MEFNKEKEKNINMQKKFLDLLQKRTNNRFYVPTINHSCGFNQCKICNIDVNLEIESNVYVFLIDEEGEEKQLTFNELIEQYPKFTLSKRYAFEDKFETWERFSRALNAEIAINLIEFNK